MRQVPSNFVAIGVFEDSIELESPVLEPGEGIYKLRDSGHRHRREFRALILENDQLRATVLPELGGRIWRLEDRALGLNPIDGGEAIQLGDCPYRGIAAVGGYLPTFDGVQPDFATGPVLDAPILPGEDGSAGIALYGFDASRRLSVETTLEMGSSAQLMVRHRIQNRRDEPVEFELGLPESAVPIWPEARIRSISLLPRQILDFSFSLAAEPEGTRFRSRGAALAWFEGKLRVRVADPVLGATLRANSETGQFDARTDLYPERFSDFDLSGLGTVGSIQILDRNGTIVLDTSACDLPELAMPTLASLGALGDPAAHVADPRWRAYAYVSLGRAALAAGDFRVAIERFESALLHDAEDALTWHHKAMAARLAAVDDEGAPDLPNAHYLSPLEPMLRAESYLRMPRDAAPEAMIEPLAAVPASMVEVACELRALGRNDEFARWAEGCLRVVDMPLMRYLLSDALAFDANLDIESAAQLQEAGKLGAIPPISGHPIALRALARLRDRFPTDAALARFAELQP